MSGDRGADRWDYTRWLNTTPGQESDRPCQRKEGPEIVITDEQGRLTEDTAGGDNGRKSLGAEHGEVGKRTNFAGTEVARARLPGIFAGM